MLGENANIAELRPVGRPRILSREQVVAAAVALGSHHVTMKRLAASLDVGVATLYKYVSGRKQLMQLVSDELMRNVALPRREGLTWAEYARAYCQALQHSMSDRPSVVHQLLDGGFGTAFSNKMCQDFVDSVVPEGLSVEQAGLLHHGICLIATGGAVGVIELHMREHHSPEPDQENPDTATRMTLSTQDVLLTAHLLLDALIEKIERHANAPGQGNQ